jgi:RibD domain-containing protein
MSDCQTLVTTGIEDAVAAAREAAGDKDVALMGGGVVTEALKAGLVDELVLHQVPVLLGAGRPYFQELPEHVRLRLVEAVPAPGVTHLHYEVERRSSSLAAWVLSDRTPHGHLIDPGERVAHVASVRNSTSTRPWAEPALSCGADDPDRSTRDENRGEHHDHNRHRRADSTAR